MNVTDSMKDYIQEKIDKLPHLYDGLQSVDVTVATEAGEFLVEIVAAGKRKRVFVAHHREEDVYACIDQCVHKVQEQLRRHKDRVRDRQGPAHDQIMQPPPAQQ